MYISNLKIQNYRNFADFAIDLKPFTLIIGENNTGKTNLLNALGLIFSQDITFFKKRVLEVDDINFEAVLSFKRSVAAISIPAENVAFPEVKVEIVMEDFTLDQEAVVGDWFIDKSLDKAQLTYLFKARNSLNKKEWVLTARGSLQNIVKESGETDSSFDKRRIDNVNFPINEYEYLVFGANDSSKRAESYFLKMLKMEFLEALRDATRELMASRDYRLLYRVLNNREEECFKEIKDALIKLENLIDKNLELNKIKNDIKEYLDKISLFEKDIENNVDFHFSSPECCEILKKLSLIYGENPINIERNGLGRNNLLYISLILSHLIGSDSKTDKVFFRLIGIEEPEAHLHPHLQDHLARNVKEEVGNNKDFQIVLTSHSANIAAKLDLENTVILYKESGGEIKKHYILEGFGGSKEEQQTVRYLKKFIDATNSTMFFARKVILLEGISEELLMPVLFRIYTGSVEKKKVVEIFGTDDSWKALFDNSTEEPVYFKDKFEKLTQESTFDASKKDKLLSVWEKRGKNKTLEKIRCNIVDVKGVAFKHFLRIIKKGYFIKCLVLTDSDTEKMTENRAQDLKIEYASINVIKIQSSSASTFEKDILESNKTGKGREILLNALIQTRPMKGSELKEEIGSADIDADSFFPLIENYKSEFSFNLTEELKKDYTGFIIPTYITEGFDFILNK